MEITRQTLHVVVGIALLTALAAGVVVADETLAGEIVIEETAENNEEFVYSIAQDSNVDNANVVIEGVESEDSQTNSFDELSDGDNRDISVAGNAETDLHITLTGVGGASVDLWERSAFYEFSDSGDGKIYHADEEGLIAIDPADGSILWTFSETSDQVDSDIIYNDGSVIFGDGDAIVYSVDSTDGSLNWQYDADSDSNIGIGGNKIHLDVFEGSVYMGTIDTFFGESEIFAIDLETGNQEWGPVNINDDIYSLGVVDGFVISGDDSGDIHSLDVNDGSTQYSETISDNRLEVGVESVGGVAVIGESQDVFAVDPETGTIEWDWDEAVGETLFNLGNEFASNSGIVYIQSGEGIHAVDVDNASTIFSNTDIGSSRGGITLSNGMLYAASGDESLAEIDPDDGSFDILASANDEIRSEISIEDNIAVLHDLDSNQFGISILGPADSPSVTVDDRTVGTDDKLSDGESHEGTITNVSPGDYAAGVSLDDSVVDVDIQFTQTTITESVEINIDSGSGSQSLTHSGRIGSGETVDLTDQIDKSAISDDVSIDVSVSDDVDGPTGQVGLDYSHDAEFDDSQQLDSAFAFLTDAPETTIEPTPEDGTELEERDLSVEAKVGGGGLDIGGEADVEIVGPDGSTELETTIDTETTLSTELDSGVAGENDWTVIVDDQLTGETTTETFSFSVPSEVEIRDISDVELVETESEVEVEFLGSSGTVETRTAQNGVVDMEGLPADERFAIIVDTDGEYINRQAIVSSILEQQTVWLLPDDGSIETVENRFTLSDPTDQFDEQESEIIIERPIQIDGETEYRAVAGDRFGINGYDAILEREQRYRIVVTDPASGSERRLGEFTPTQAEEVNFEIEEIEFDLVEEAEGFSWGAAFDDQDEQISITFDDDRDIQVVDVIVAERGFDVDDSRWDPEVGTFDDDDDDGHEWDENESKIIHDESYLEGTTVTVPVEDTQQNYVVIIRANLVDKDEDIIVEHLTGPDEIPVGEQLGDRWQTIISLLTLIVMAGLFGAVHPAIGGISISSTGGIFWMMGWLPGDTTGLMVLLALFISVLAYATRRGVQ